jgi:hypothetical protein
VDLFGGGGSSHVYLRWELEYDEETGETFPSEDPFWDRCKGESKERRDTFCLLLPENQFGDGYETTMHTPQRAGWDPTGIANVTVSVDGDDTIPTEELQMLALVVNEAAEMLRVHTDVVDWLLRIYRGVDGRATENLGACEPLGFASYRDCVAAVLAGGFEVIFVTANGDNSPICNAKRGLVSFVPGVIGHPK